jgi:hypothetical protein
VNFRLAYVDDDLLVQDKESIAQRYLRGWFAIDFASSVSSLLNELASSGGAVSMLRNLRILRLMRLLKLVRLLKLGTLLQSLDGIADEMSVVVRLCKVRIERGGQGAGVGSRGEDKEQGRIERGGQRAR